jgi:hypothetical protein
MRRCACMRVCVCVRACVRVCVPGGRRTCIARYHGRPAGHHVSEDHISDDHISDDYISDDYISDDSLSLSHAAGRTPRAHGVFTGRLHYLLVIHPHRPPPPPAPPPGQAVELVAEHHISDDYIGDIVSYSFRLY